MNRYIFISLLLVLVLFSCDFCKKNKTLNNNKSYTSVNIKSDTIVKKNETLNNNESEARVNIKYKKNSNDWENLGTLIIRKEEIGIAVGLHSVLQNKVYSATFFEVEESEIDTFKKAMTESGSFNSNKYYGYSRDNNSPAGKKTISTKVETIDSSQYITFSENKYTFAIPLDELKGKL